MKAVPSLALAALSAAALAIGGLGVLHADEDIKRDLLQHADLTGDPREEVYMVRAEAPPGTTFERHSHHGDEFTYVISGTVEIDIDGQGPRTVTAGDSLALLRGQVHGARITGSEPATLLIVRIVDKGKPLTEIAK